MPRPELAVPPYTSADVGSRFWRRLEQHLARLDTAPPGEPLAPPPPAALGSAEQVHVVRRLLEAFTSSSPRLVALVAERGRGKSSALGLALAAARAARPILFGFSVHSAHVLICAHRWGYPKRTEHRLAMLETATAVALWAAVAISIGPVSFLFAYLVPLMVANAIVMGFILTNHSLSPMTAQNDPPLNSLSVTLPRSLEWLTLRFGYHVEHHIFPSMSSRHAPHVRALLRSRWPGRYQSMSLPRALLMLHRTPRVYKTHETLVDPRTSRECPALLPTTNP